MLRGYTPYRVVRFGAVLLRTAFPELHHTFFGARRGDDVERRTGGKGASGGSIWEMGKPLLGEDLQLDLAGRAGLRAHFRHKGRYAADQDVAVRQHHRRVVVPDVVDQRDERNHPA